MTQLPNDPNSQVLCEAIVKVVPLIIAVRSLRFCFVSRMTRPTRLKSPKYDSLFVPSIAATTPRFVPFHRAFISKSLEYEMRSSRRALAYLSKKKEEFTLPQLPVQASAALTASWNAMNQLLQATTVVSEALQRPSTPAQPPLAAPPLAASVVAVNGAVPHHFQSPPAAFPPPPMPTALPQQSFAPSQAQPSHDANGEAMSSAQASHTYHIVRRGVDTPITGVVFPLLRPFPPPLSVASSPPLPQLSAADKHSATTGALIVQVSPMPLTEPLADFQCIGCCIPSAPVPSMFCCSWLQFSKELRLSVDVTCHALHLMGLTFRGSVSAVLPWLNAGGHACFAVASVCLSVSSHGLKRHTCESVLEAIAVPKDHRKPSVEEVSTRVSPSFAGPSHRHPCYHAAGEQRYAHDAVRTRACACARCPLLPLFPQ